MKVLKNLCHALKSTAIPGINNVKAKKYPTRALCLMVQPMAKRTKIFTDASLNLSYFFVEFYMAKNIESVSLFADSIDFLEDASVNILILLAMGWSIKQRARVGYFFAFTLLISNPVSPFSGHDFNLAINQTKDKHPY